MSGKKGRSGRTPMVIENNCKKDIDAIRYNVHKALRNYTNMLLKKSNKDELTTNEAQQLATLHIKHSPQHKEEQQDTAIDLLSRMAIEGAREFAKIRAMRSDDIHAKIVNDIGQEQDLTTIDITT